MRPNFHYLIFIFLFLLNACTKEDDLAEIAPCDTVCDYLFLGHIYESPNTIDERIAGADLSPYKQIWLGGDLCSETTREESTLEYLDSLFDLGGSSTHWTVGNHDIRNGNLNWITSRTERELFYTEHFDGIILLVLNTNYRDTEDCTWMEEQLAMIESVCDTISESSHLVVLMHQVVWGGIDEAMQPITFGNNNGSWIPFQCFPLNRFKDAVYPELLKAQQRGVSVVCIAGDMGQVAASFEFTTDEGVVFLASGITSETLWNEQWPTYGQQDSVLVLTHDLIGRELSWEFINVENI